MPIDTLVNELIALGTLDETTIADLRRMQTEAADGKLDGDDEIYITALHARLTNQPLSDALAQSTDTEGERLDGHTLTEWRDRALAAEAEAATLRDQLAAAGTAPEPI